MTCGDSDGGEKRKRVSFEEPSNWESGPFSKVDPIDPPIGLARCYDEARLHSGGTMKLRIAIVGVICFCIGAASAPLSAPLWAQEGAALSAGVFGGGKLATTEMESWPRAGNWA